MQYANMQCKWQNIAIYYIVASCLRLGRMLFGAVSTRFCAQIVNSKDKLSGKCLVIINFTAEH